MPRSGFPKVLAICLSLSGCVYSLSSGSGFPSNVKTVAVSPFDNDTPSPELTQELLQELRKGLTSRLGLRDAPESRAHARVRGTITKYEVDIPVGFSADPALATSARRKLQLVIDVEIVEEATGRVLYERKGLSGEGEYNERDEAAGRKAAIQRVITEIVEGAQSQW
jgi:Lipopolysaccharide-assembly